MDRTTDQITLVAARAGRLPPPVGASVAGVVLPRGAHVVSDPQFCEVAPGPATAWVSEEPLPDVARLWWPLARAFAQTGLWPIVAFGLEDGDLSRPWRTGELTEALDPTTADVEEVLGRAWSTCGGPDTPFPGPVPGVPGPPGVADVPLLTALPAGGLMLVPVLEPADVPARVGWQGAINSDFMGAEISAVLRSWQRRFGAVLVGIGFDRLEVVATRQPLDEVHLIDLAHEVFALAPDEVPVEHWIDHLRVSDRWSLWWD